MTSYGQTNFDNTGLFIRHNADENNSVLSIGTTHMKILMESTQVQVRLLQWGNNSYLFTNQRLVVKFVGKHFKGN